MHLMAGWDDPLLTGEQIGKLDTRAKGSNINVPVRRKITIYKKISYM
jgi:hypothetical protein